MYTLIIEDRHGRSAAEISFDHGSYSIGRVDGNDVVLPSNSVSRSHARIFVANNKCYITDLGSANGVLVDGALIQDKTEIKNGSKIRIGEYTLYLEYKDQKEMNAGQDVLKTQIVSGNESGYKLVRVGDKFAGEEFMLTEASNSIGRTEDNYILLTEDSISRNHAKIVNVNLNYFVVDLGSSNGTFVNNKKIQGQVPLHGGDLIRFGSDVSFVFVPATQRVDLAAYANAGPKRNDNRMFIGFFLGLLIFIVVAVALVVGLLMSRCSEPQEPQEVAQESALEKFESRLNEAKNLADRQHFEAAKNITMALLKENPDNKEKMQTRSFNDALRILKSIDETNGRYEEVEKLIASCESGIRIAKINDARSNCEAGLSLSCVDEYCTVAQKLDSQNDTEKDRIRAAIEFMDSISQKKSKYQARAKKCSKSLKDMLAD